MDFICFAVFSLHLDSNMPLCYLAIPSRSLRRDGADLKGFGISQQAFCRAKFAFAQRSGAMKAPVGLLSDRTVCDNRWRGFAPTSSAHDAQNADNARKNTAFPPVCKKCAKVCRAPKKENPTRNLAIPRGILVRSRELESLTL